MIDIQVLDKANDLVELEGTPAGVDELTALYPGAAAFTGVELCGLLLDADQPTILAAVRACQPIPVAQALSMRAVLLWTVDGRLGVTVGGNQVVEPAGRAWAYVAPVEPGRYRWAGLHPNVTYTMTGRQ